jgi:hypothetical protein
MQYKEAIPSNEVLFWMEFSIPDAIAVGEVALNLSIDPQTVVFTYPRI